MRGRDYFARARVKALIEMLALAAAALSGALAFPLAAKSSTAVLSDNMPAPDFVLKSTDGRNLRLSEYRGDVVVLTFWASWCGSCRSALTELNAIAVAPDAGSPVVLGVSLDGDASLASSVAESLGLRFPTLVDHRQAIGRLYDVEALPLTLVVDRDGVVRQTWAASPAPKAELNRVLEEIGQ